jgi:hypothetical protein
MNSQKPLQHTPGIRHEELNWVATSALARDQEQSHRLHEPDHLIGTIDPMTGRDIIDVKGHPSIVDGILTIYFESDFITRRTLMLTSVVLSLGLVFLLEMHF